MNNSKTSAQRKKRSINRNVTICNPKGLHARASAKFVKLAGMFNAEITVSKGGQEVSGLSIMGLMMLAAGPQTEIAITATGAQAADAMDAICAMLEDRREDV